MATTKEIKLQALEILNRNCGGTELSDFTVKQARQVIAEDNAKILSSANIEIGLEIELANSSTFGNWIVGQDSNGWTIKGNSGSKMLFEYDFKYYRIVS